MGAITDTELPEDVSSGYLPLCPVKPALVTSSPCPARYMRPLLGNRKLTVCAAKAITGLNLSLIGL